MLRFDGEDVAADRFCFFRLIEGAIEFRLGDGVGYSSSRDALHFVSHGSPSHPTSRAARRGEFELAFLPRNYASFLLRSPEASIISLTRKEATSTLREPKLPRRSGHLRSESECDGLGGRRISPASDNQVGWLLVVAFGQVCGSWFEVAEEATGAFVGACGEVKLGAGSAGGIVAADRGVVAWADIPEAVDRDGISDGVL